MRARSPETPGHPLHVIQRGHLRSPCFFGDEDCVAYLAWLGEYALRCDCSLHAYVLMFNHVHLLLTPSVAGGVASLMRLLGERYARYVEDSHRRHGPLWEGRFEAVPVHVRQYLLSCMRYIELNPVRGGLVESPGQYRWSSYGANAMGHDDVLLSPHSYYCALGRDATTRQAAYRALFQGKASAGTPRRARVREQSDGLE